MAWREDTRRKPNGMLYLLVASTALAHPEAYVRFEAVLVRFKGT